MKPVKLDSKLKLVFSHTKEPGEWDFAAGDLGGGFYHCHASAVYGAGLIGGDPLFVEARDESGRCVGIAVGTLISSKIWPFSKHCSIATFPATPVAAGDREVELWILQNLEQMLKENGVFRLDFASYHSHNSNDLLKLSGYNLNARNEYEFDLTRDADELFKAFSAKKRNQVRRAEKKFVETHVVESRDAMELVEKLHNLSMERRGGHLSKMSDDFVSLRLDLARSGRTRIFVSYIGDEPVCADLFGVFNGQVYGLRSGSSSVGNKNYAPVHLCWTAIQYFKKEGFALLSLGGAREEEAGLRKFKMELGTTESQQPSGFKVLSRVGSGLDSVRTRLRP